MLSVLLRGHVLTGSLDLAWLHLNEADRICGWHECLEGCFRACLMREPAQGVNPLLHLN